MLRPAFSSMCRNDRVRAFMGYSDRCPSICVLCGEDGTRSWPAYTIPTRALHSSGSAAGCRFHRAPPPWPMRLPRNSTHSFNNARLSGMRRCKGGRERPVTLHIDRCNNSLSRFLRTFQRRGIYRSSSAHIAAGCYEPGCCLPPCACRGRTGGARAYARVAGIVYLPVAHQMDRCICHRLEITAEFMQSAICSILIYTGML